MTAAPAAPRIVTRPVPAAPGLAGLPELLRRLYASRGALSREALDYGLTRLPDYAALSGIDTACDLLESALADGQPILVVGDFDVDGASSAALVCDALVAMGATAVDCFIPNRLEHGYGLSPRVVEAIAEKGIRPGLLITVDNGISSIDGVAAARAGGRQVLVTDHHLPGPTLPAADAIVNPNQPGCGAFGRNLAGVGVAFYLMLALRGRLRHKGQQALPHMGDYLDLVALGTVADVVPMDHLNRLLVAQGLRRIRAGRTRPGIAALAAAAGRDTTCLTPADIGFGIAPRLNAAGRLEDMRIGVACLRSSQRTQADMLAAELSSINNERRLRQAEMQADAEQALAQCGAQDDPPAGLVVFNPNWHQGIVGLVAGRLCERYKRPVIAFAQTGEDGELKGSARSVDGVHIRDVLAAIAAADPALVQRFGGHARAAGLSLAPGQLVAFRQAFEAAAAERLTPAMRDDRSIVTDGLLTDAELDLSTAACLRDAGPWGSEFDAPLFHGDFEVVDSRLLKDKHLKMVARSQTGRRQIDAIAFNHGELVPGGTIVRLVYRLEVNRYRGQDSANLIVEHVLTPD